LQEIAQKSKKELQDERMTLDMYKSHHGALHEHAERLGAVGKMDNVISSFRGFFNITRAGNEPEQPTKAVVNKSQKPTDASREKERRVSGKSTPSNISPAAAAAVGGIAYTDSVTPSSDFFRKTPKIFKIGGGGGSSNPDVLKSITNEEREIHISDESSAQSSITMSDDGDEVTASMTES
jgi:hypothetical protein